MRRFFLLASIGAAAVCGGTAALAGGGAVRFRDIQGDVVLSRGEKFLVCEKGMRCEKGDQILTRGPARADITWSGLWGCRMLESTILTVADTDAGNMAVRLEKGATLFRFKTLPARAMFRLETPTAIASVRGTQFASWVTDEGGRDCATFAVLRGKVQVAIGGTGIPQMVELGDGEALDVARASAPYRKRSITEAERKILAQTEDLSTGKPDPSGRYG